MRALFFQTFRLEPSTRKLVSGGAALGLLAVVAAATALLMNGYLQRRDDIAALRSEVSRLLERAVEVSGGQSVEATLAADATDLLAPNAEAAAAHLQSTLRGLAIALGTTEIRLDSVRALTALPEGNAIAVRVSASLTAPGPRAFDVVNALEAATPPIGIDSIRIVSRLDSNGARDRGQQTLAIARAELTFALRAYARSSPVMPGSVRPGERQTVREGVVK